MTSKRPLSSSSESSEDSSDSAPANHPVQIKKVKVDSQDDVPAVIVTDPIHGDLRSAINIKTALDRIEELPKLGYCPTKVQQFCKEFRLNSIRGEESDSNEEDFKDRDLANQAILNELKTVYKDMESLSISHACGTLDYSSDFQLRITRPGCEYDGAVSSYSNQTQTLLSAWFEYAAISGYGDMESLETKVDPDVRNAREIPASEFQVPPQFLKDIQKLWGERFLPRNVLANPYKIHLYGPGGHFKFHRDTPETGLVGTFLVGLGDTSTTSGGNFRIADITLKAKPRSWVAFHPDVPHEITKVEGGYRAVVAFKIFRVADNEDEVLPAQLEARVKRIHDRIPTPFGLFTTHKYSMGTTSLNGFDTLISAYARSRSDAQAHMLPVVTKFYGEAFDEGNEHVAESSVYPFTTAHVDILLKKNVAQAKEQVKWLKGFKKIPFYTWNIRASTDTWQEDHPDGANFTGNEADSSREDSIYLSYAMLFLSRLRD